MTDGIVICVGVGCWVVVVSFPLKKKNPRAFLSLNILTLNLFLEKYKKKIEIPSHPYNINYRDI